MAVGGGKGDEEAEGEEKEERGEAESGLKWMRRWGLKKRERTKRAREGERRKGDNGRSTAAAING